MPSLPTAFRSILKIGSTCFLTLVALGASAPFAPVAAAEDIKVAFIGDQGIAEEAQRVLELIRDEGTDLLLIQGDLGYDNNSADKWIENMDNILGRDFPVLMVVGNHENYEWPKYLEWQQDKLSRVSDIRCEGSVSVKAYCTYKNIGVVQVSPGITEVEGINGSDDYAGYINEKFKNDNSTWRFCSWHKNMRDMQAGGKPDATGWGVYQNCLAQGGLVMTGHEHSYSRTHLMSDFQNREVLHTGDEMDIGPNSSLAFVSGLGGREVREQRHGGDWFASIYTSTQGASPGSLFCTLNGDQADCYFKDIAGLVPDAFKLRSKFGSTDDSAADSEPDIDQDSDEPNDEELSDDNESNEQSPDESDDQEQSEDNEPNEQLPDESEGPEQSDSNNPEAQSPDESEEAEQSDDDNPNDHSPDESDEDGQSDADEQLVDDSEGSDQSDSEGSEPTDSEASNQTDPVDAGEQVQPDPEPVDQTDNEESESQAPSEPEILVAASDEEPGTQSESENEEPVPSAETDNDERSEPQAVVAGAEPPDTSSGSSELDDELTDSENESQHSDNPFGTIPTSVADNDNTPIVPSSPQPPLIETASTGGGSAGWVTLLAMALALALRTRVNSSRVKRRCHTTSCTASLNRQLRG